MTSPGPWTRKPGTLSIKDARGDLVANVACGDRRKWYTDNTRVAFPTKPRPEALANAALMTAAPELLAALKTLVDDPTKIEAIVAASIVIARAEAEDMANAA